MQPYFMPYIGYWQLFAAADKFIILDDVAFIRRGWINRNRILVNGTVHRFSLPVSQASQHRLINELELAVDLGWLKSFRSTLAQNYRKAPFFDETQAFLEPVLASCRGPLLPFVLRSIEAMATHLGIGTPLALSSTLDRERRNSGQARIINLCCHEKASQYLNLPGGRRLYDPYAFRQCGVQLQFIVPRQNPYPQFCERWWPSLSIIDLLMHMGRSGARNELSQLDIGTCVECGQS